MRAGRKRASLRGWGGVAAMAVVCALAALLTLLLPLTASRGGDGAADPGGSGVADASRVNAGQRAPECTDPQDQSLAPSTVDGTTVEEIKARGELVVGVDQNGYRWGYRDPNRQGQDVQLEGFDIDLARRIAQELLGSPDKIIFKAIPTNQRIPAIQSGQVDMVVRTMTISCTRMEDVAFSAPYFMTGQQVLAPVTSDITGYDDSLAGQEICSASGSTAFERLEADQKAGELTKEADISTTVPNQLDCLVRLQLGEVDAVVTDGALAASQAAQDPTVGLKGERFTTEYYGVAMKKGADDLVRRVNRILEDYRQDNGWQDSYDRWLSDTMGADSESATPPVPEYRQ
ncbi:glutamate ABC transporter substrate-binding protein [Streptomyces sp. NPDC093252]|uniref:glutamate ABC transporter substrate-binding protein n=1 Tax=Streptomyces sp. NPDC093252 TaxID=3154980 RepID=UPI0034455895